MELTKSTSLSRRRQQRQLEIIKHRVLDIILHENIASPEIHAKLKSCSRRAKNWPRTLHSCVGVAGKHEKHEDVTLMHRRECCCGDMWCVRIHCLMASFASLRCHSFFVYFRVWSFSVHSHISPPHGAAASTRPDDTRRHGFT